MRKRVVAGSYACAVLCIVLLADFGKASSVFRFVKSFPYGDKVAHFTLMGLLALAVNMALSCRIVRPGRVPLLVGSLWVALVVAVEEAMQYYIPTRSCDPYDLLADFLGILLVGSLALLAGRTPDPRSAPSA
jgi:polysaccharide biosynthesis protein VpsQ